MKVRINQTAIAKREETMIQAKVKDEDEAMVDRFILYRELRNGVWNYNSTLVPINFSNKKIYEKIKSYASGRFFWIVW